MQLANHLERRIAGCIAFLAVPVKAVVWAQQGLKPWQGSCKKRGCNNGTRLGQCTIDADQVCS
jgi:hypothetical protein